MIMLISIDAFYNIFSFEIQSYKSVEGQSVNWNLRKTNKRVKKCKKCENALLQFFAKNCVTMQFM